MDFLKGIAGKITPEMNEHLGKAFDANEVTEALQQMDPHKAPSPNGMAPTFFQKYWDIVGSDLSAEVLRDLNSGEMPGKLNHTFISLIPKKKKAERVVDYIPICLCNVMYKLMSKCLANRLKATLPQLISRS